MPPPIVLASTSRYRQELFARLSIPFSIEAPLVDESTTALHRKPAERAMLLALAKARAVAQRRPEAIVIGSDQVCTIDGRCFDKPGTIQDAVAQLCDLQGRLHEIITAVHLETPDGPIAFVERAFLKMRPLSEAALRRYVELDQPLDCAGSYRIEGRGICLFEAVTTADHTTIIGLPLLRLCEALITLGFQVP